MRRFRQVARVVYLAAAVVVTGGLTGLLFGPYTERFATLLSSQGWRIGVAVAIGIVCVQMLVTLVRLFTDRPAPNFVHPGGNESIEVSCTALETVAATAAGERDVMVERALARVVGREHDEVRIELELIPFVEHGLEGMAHRIQQRVADACEQTLGTPSVTVRVRFLPSKTVTTYKEVSGE